MTEYAGEIEQRLLWKQEHLAPLPVPTGQPACDLMNIIWRKNDVYLDIGSFAMAAGWLTLHCLSVMFVVVSIWVASTGDYWAGLAILALCGGGGNGPSLVLLYQTVAQTTDAADSLQPSAP